MQIVAGEQFGQFGTFDGACVRRKDFHCIEAERCRLVAAVGQAIPENKGAAFSLRH